MEQLLEVMNESKGINGARLTISGTQEQQIQFREICNAIKRDAGLMQQSEHQYEFLHNNIDTIREVGS